MTSELVVRYRHPVPVNDKPLIVKGKVRDVRRNIAIIDAFLYDHEGKLCTQAECKYFTFSDEISKRDFNYPGKEAFYNHTF